MEQYTYLLIIICSIAIPFGLSFEKKIHFYKKWKYISPALFITSIIFIFWDIIFTKYGIWGFNNQYITGIYLLNLPIEEILFFVVIPYCCLFIYEIVITYLPDFYNKTFVIISVLISILCLVIGLMNLEKLYSAIVFLSTSIVIPAGLLFMDSNKYVSRFYLMFLIALIPFFIVNGLLTSFPVVWYNQVHNLSVLVYTIPIEDFIYNFLLLFVNVVIYEKLNKRFYHKKN